MKTCKTCLYWKPIAKNIESWGVCKWFDRNDAILPIWVKFHTSSGALSPDQAYCQTHTPFPEDQQPKTRQGRDELTISKRL